MHITCGTFSSVRGPGELNRDEKVRGEVKGSKTHEEVPWTAVIALIFYLGYLLVCLSRSSEL